MQINEQTNKQNKRAKKSERKTKKSRNVLLYLGLIIGIVLFSAPFIFGIYTQREQDNAKNAYVQKENNTDSSKISKKIEEYNSEIYRGQQADGVVDGTDQAQAILKDLKRPIAYIKIPAINLDPMMVYYGTSDWVLNRGIGNINWTSMPIGGKNTLSVLSGHSGLANQIFFDNIKHLKKKDVVFLHAFDKDMAYAVTRKIVISPNSKADLRKLHIKKGQDEIALVTCTPVFINTNRLIVFAKRIPLSKAQDEKIIPRDLWSLEHIFMMLIGSFLLFIISYLIWSKYHRKKSLTNGSNQEKK